MFETMRSSFGHPIVIGGPGGMVHVGPAGRPEDLEGGGVEGEHAGETEGA